MAHQLKIEKSDVSLQKRRNQLPFYSIIRNHFKQWCALSLENAHISVLFAYFTAFSKSFAILPLVLHPPWVALCKFILKCGFNFSQKTTLKSVLILFSCFDSKKAYVNCFSFVQMILYNGNTHYMKDSSACEVHCCQTTASILNSLIRTIFAAC